MGSPASPGCRSSHLVRSFGATYGETPIRYLTRRRIERAQDLLRAANLTVTEICMLVGFSRPRLVLLTVHPAGRQDADRVPAPLGGPGRATRPRAATSSCAAR